MTAFVLPPELDTLFARPIDTPTDQEALMTAVLPAVCHVLKTDRCFLMVRHPRTRMNRIFCWRRSAEFPDMSIHIWEPEQEWEQEDPLFAAGLAMKPSIFVDDVETADATVLNREFEHKNFGHRALIHAHLGEDGQLWGILQPCIFAHPRQWSEFDRAVIDQIVAKLTPIVIEYVKAVQPAESD